MHRHSSEGFKTNEPVSEGSTYLRTAAFSPCDLDINPMTLKLERDLDILKCTFTLKMKLLG